MTPMTIHSPPATSPAVSSVADHTYEIKSTVSRLQHSASPPQCERLLQRVRDLLAAMPLSTGEYGRAICLVDNVQRYLASGERGAADYELRLLAGTIAGWDH